MKVPFLSSIFNKEESLTASNSSLQEKIESLSQNSNFLIFKDKEILHHKERYPITLLIYDHLRGIYIFEIKKWSYKDLKNATAQKSENVEKAQNTLAFDKTHSIIRQKFNELLHNDGVRIFNYLLMENLSSTEYENLNDSLQNMLPKERIIFSDSDTSEIFKKLQNATQETDNLPSVDKILGTLFIQYAILDKECIYLANQEQIKFIDTKIEGREYLLAPPKSGKSTTLLLKAIQELFKKERKKIVLIKPTRLSKDILHKEFLELIEHAIIDIDLMAFEILTPIELLNKHLLKLKMPLLEDKLYIDKKLLHKNIDIAELILCDDANLLPDDFLNYLKHIQKKSDLLLVNRYVENPSFQYTQSYLSQERKIYFHHTNPHAKALHLVSSLLKSSQADEIIIISNEENREKLKEDLTSFIESDPYTLDASKQLFDQKLESVILTTYSDIVDIQAKNIILMDLCFENKDILLYACNIASQRVDILYDESCQEIESLKEIYENSQK